MTRIMLTVLQVMLFLIMLLLYLSGIGCKDSRSGVFLCVGIAGVMSPWYTIIYIGGIL